MAVTDCTIYGEAFHKLREDFDKMMNETIMNMQRKGSSDASITIKLDIELEKTFAPVEDLDGSRTTRDVYIPHFSHKVSSAMSIKSEVKGKFDEECELIWDPAGQRHLLVPIGQLPLASEYEREDDDE
jgi:hypothetical protein